MSEEEAEATRADKSPEPERSKRDRPSRAGVSTVGMRPKILAFFRKHPNVNVYTSQLMKQFGKEAQSVQQAIHQLRSSGHPIAIIQRGQIYRYAPNGRGPGQPFDVPVTTEGSNRVGKTTAKTPALAFVEKRTFTEVGATKDGWYVIQAEDGALFRAEPL